MWLSPGDHVVFWSHGFLVPWSRVLGPVLLWSSGLVVLWSPDLWSRGPVIPITRSSCTCKHRVHQTIKFKHQNFDKHQKLLNELRKASVNARSQDPGSSGPVVLCSCESVVL